jgi:diguanylate cyclase (GGDEF)-like protein
MDSAYLLVIDDSPESAEEINSLLRNSGISIHVLFASTTAETKLAIEANPPCLVIHNLGAKSGAPVSEVINLCTKNHIPIAIRFSPHSPDRLFEVLACGCCIALNAEDNSQLTSLVQQQLRSGRTATDQAGLEQKLEELEYRYQLLLDSARDSIAYIHEGLHVYANRAYLECMQVNELNEISGLSLLELMRGDDTDLKQLFRNMQKGEFAEKSVPVTVTNPSGTEFKVELTFSAAKFEGEDCIQMVMREKDGNALLKEELNRLRHIDELTQLANRKAFTEHLDGFIEENRTSEVSSAVFYVEPDDIESLQRDLGVNGMDSFIADLAQVIQRCIGADDLAARFSDHGFAILARHTDKMGVQDVGDCVVQSFSNHIVELEGKTITASCSAGMATLGTLTHSADEVLSQAHTAFSEASQSGNRMVRYKPQLTTVASDEEDKHWVERIRYALNNRDLYSIQQSIVNLDGELEGLFENRTFLREEDGDRSPEEFLPAAERNDLGSSIDRYVIPGLLKAISGTGDRHIINLSCNSILDFSFPGWFGRQLDENDVQGTQVIIQLSARSAESNLKPAGRLIEELKPLGCTFSLSGFDDQRKYCQLLEHLDISLVKLRHGLAQGVNHNSPHLDIIRNVVSETEPADIAVIADEVQDAADLAVLWQCGVKLVAGEFLKEAPQVVGQ